MGTEAEEAVAIAAARLRGAVMARLIEFCEDGVPIVKTDSKTGETRIVGRAPAPAPYLSAALKFLKDVGALGPAADAAAALEAELGRLPEFEDEAADDAD